VGRAIRMEDEKIHIRL